MPGGLLVNSLGFQTAHDLLNIEVPTAVLHMQPLRAHTIGAGLHPGAVPGGNRPPRA